MSMDSTVGPWQDPPAQPIGPDHPVMQAAQAAAQDKFEQMVASKSTRQAPPQQQARGVQILKAWGEGQDAAPVYGHAEETFQERGPVRMTDREIAEGKFNNEGPGGPDKQFYEKHPVPSDSEGNMGWSNHPVELGKPADVERVGAGVLSEGPGRLATQEEIAAQAGTRRQEVHARQPASRDAAATEGPEDANEGKSAVRPSFKGAGRGKIPQEVIEAARKTEAKYNVPASVTVAQWALESGYGKRMLGGSNNPFGIKARKGQDFVEGHTHEQGKNGLVRTTAKFAKYASLTEAFEEHARLIAEKPAYKKAMERNWDLHGFISAMSPKYASDRDYAHKLLGIIRTQRLASA